jgi:preprotein translocase subunit SecE
MQHQRWVVLSFIVTTVLTAWTVQAASVSAFAQFAIPDSRVGPVNLSTILGLVAGVVALLGLLRSQRAVTFTDEVIDELAKVTWPTREETIRASYTVVVTTLMVAVLLGLYDFVWKNLADLVLLHES